MGHVEAIKTSVFLIPRSFDVTSAVFSAALIPFFPLQALAFPAFAIIARAFPPLRFFMLRMTGAAFTLF
jgi:hypothetical protein